MSIEIVLAQLDTLLDKAIAAVERNEVLEFVEYTADLVPKLAEGLQRAFSDLERRHTLEILIARETINVVVRGDHSSSALHKQHHIYADFYDSLEHLELCGDLTALVIEIDHLNRFNDRFGQDNPVLEAFRALLGVWGQNHIVVQDGDRFVVIVRDHVMHGIDLADRIVNLARDYPWPTHLGMTEAPSGMLLADRSKDVLTVSIGVTTRGPKDLLLSEILDRADEALCLSQNLGGCQFTIG
jgi:GGDEF domain-containing protein